MQKERITSSDLTYSTTPLADQNALVPLVIDTPRGSNLRDTPDLNTLHTTRHTTHKEPHTMTHTTPNPRIAHIQKYANDNGYALALPLRSTGLHGIGYPLAGSQQSRILDKAANTLISIVEG